MDLQGLEASDWVYSGEGGHHAVFEYVGTSRDFSGLLLTLRKHDLAISEWILTKELESCEESSTSHVDDEFIRFMKGIVTVCISPQYLDIPRPLALDWSMLQELRQRTLLQHDIPSRRRHAWSMAKPARETESALPSMVHGLLLPNYKTWPQEGHDHGCIALELKPKAGYTAMSPLVDPLRRIKYHHTRFELLQDLAAQGVVQKPWSGTDKNIRTSDYNPLDLFSNQHDRIAKALTALLACPQNNIRIWCRGNHVLGVDSTGRDLVPDWNCVADLFGVSREHASTVLIDAVASILQQEPLLQQLLRLQRLDIIDGDGAVLLYQRIVDLLGGSDSEAQTLLNEYTARPPNENQPTRLHPLLSHSPLEPLNDLARIQAYCELVDHVRTSLETLTPNTAAALEEARRDALQLMDSFDVHDCRFMLQNWLLSLVMCDVSVFVRLRPARGSSTDKKVAIPTMNDLKFEYDLKVIDCDQKPASKLQSRPEKEVIFNHRSVLV